jgi:hypothetical protein
MIDATKDQLIPLSDVPAWMQRRGLRPVTARQVRRWHTEGIKGRKLQVMRVGRYYATSEAALIELFERWAAPTPAKLTPSQQAIAQRRAAAILEKFRI